MNFIRACVADTLTDAEGAHRSMGALVELLEGCPPGHQLTAGNVLGIVSSVLVQMDNVVDGLRTAHRRPPVSP